MATKPTNDNDRVVVESGTPIGTGPSPPPPSLDGTTDNTDDKVTTTLVTTEPPILMLTGSDVAAICKLLTQPINDEERQFIRRMKTYLAEQGGSDAILQRCSEAAGGGGGGQSGPGTAERTGTDVDDGSTNNINCLLLDHGRIDTSNPTGTADDGSPAAKNDLGAGRHHPVTTSSLFTEILNYLDQKSLIEASFVSKPWNIICHSPTMEHAIVPYVRLTVNLSSGLDGITNFVRKMKIHFEEREALKNKYQRFELHVIGNRPNTLENSYWHLDDDGSYYTPPYDEIKSNNIYSIIGEMPHYLRMDGIISLVITVSRDTDNRALLNCYWYLFSKMFPQLRDLNVLDSECNGWAILENGFGAFFDKYRDYCPHLTKVDFQTKDRHILWDGRVEEPCTVPLSSLTEIYIDDHMFVFSYDAAEGTMETLQFLREYSTDYKVLERLSIRNARYVEEWPTSHNPSTIQADKIPQKHLVQFVRNAPPALKWFRSDLSQENIEMLKNEKPNIEFVN